MISTSTSFILASVLVLLLSAAALLTCHGQPIDIDSTGEFSLSRGRRFQLFNQYRQDDPDLRLSLTGSAIYRVIEKNSTVRTFLLEDGGELDFMLTDNATDGVRRHYFVWNSRGLNASKREVCFHFGDTGTNATWFDAYQSVDKRWPMNLQERVPLTQANCLSLNNRQKETRMRGTNVLEHLFVSSDGFAILLDGDMPLFTRRVPNYQGNIQALCISTRAQYPYQQLAKDSLASTYSDIKFHIFASENVTSVTRFAVHKAGVLPRPTQLPDEKKFIYPSWSTWPEYHSINQDDVVDYMEQLQQAGFPSSEISLTSYWRADPYKELAFDSELYPEPREMLTSLHDKLFRMSVYLNHYVNDGSWDIQNYFFLGSYVTSELNFTNSNAANWYGRQLRQLQEIGVDSFVVTPFVNYCGRFSRPNAQLVSYLESVAAVSNASSSLWAFRTQHLPLLTQLTLGPGFTAQQTLQVLIPNALAASIAGYSWIAPYPIGGFSDQDGTERPSDELYIRWVQACAFMPALSFTVPPWQYDAPSSKVTKLTKRWVDFHSTRGHLIMLLARKRLKDGDPIIRPLWYSEPEDTITYAINDQFMVGNDILVAPVLEEGRYRRRVYFPRGRWIDQHGLEYQGPAWIEVEAPLEELPYFIRPCAILPINLARAGPLSDRWLDLMRKLPLLKNLPSPKSGQSSPYGVCY